MFSSINKMQSLNRLLAIVVLTVFVFTSMPVPRGFAATPLLGLPEPGTMLNVSPAFAPLLLKGIKIHPENPLMFDFILDAGEEGIKEDHLRKEGERLIKYFLASLTIPEGDQWVNLSPYEHARIITEEFGQTEMGRDLLAQDYMLKQLSSSLIYPEKDLGKDFWSRVYSKAQEKFGTTNIPVNTFNKVWVVADKARIFTKNDTVYIVDSHLKVMLDQDYMALNANSGKFSAVSKEEASQVSQLSSDMIRQLIVPEIEKEINEGKNFAQLRQMYQAVILATWYRRNLQQALLTQVYADQKKTEGVNVDDPDVKEKIYQRYIQAYKKGVFNYIKEESPVILSKAKDLNATTIPRKYFSGGYNLVPPTAAMTVVPQTVFRAATAGKEGRNVILTAAMSSAQTFEPDVEEGVSRAMNTEQNEIDALGPYIGGLDREIEKLRETFENLMGASDSGLPEEEKRRIRDRIEEFIPKIKKELLTNDRLNELSLTDLGFNADTKIRHANDATKLFFEAMEKLARNLAYQIAINQLLGVSNPNQEVNLFDGQMPSRFTKGNKVSFVFFAFAAHPPTLAHVLIAMLQSLGVTKADTVVASLTYDDARKPWLTLTKDQRLKLLANVQQILGQDRIKVAGLLPMNGENRVIPTVMMNAEGEVTIYYYIGQDHEFVYQRNADGTVKFVKLDRKNLPEFMDDYRRDGGGIQELLQKLLDKEENISESDRHVVESLKNWLVNNPKKSLTKFADEMERHFKSKPGWVFKGIPALDTLGKMFVIQRHLSFHQIKANINVVSTTRPDETRVENGAYRKELIEPAGNVVVNIVQQQGFPVDISATQLRQAIYKLIFFNQFDINAFRGIPVSILVEIMKPENREYLYSFLFADKKSVETGLRVPQALQLMYPADRKDEDERKEELTKELIKWLTADPEVNGDDPKLKAGDVNIYRKINGRQLLVDETRTDADRGGGKATLITVKAVNPDGSFEQLFEVKYDVLVTMTTAAKTYNALDEGDVLFSGDYHNKDIKVAVIKYLRKLNYVTSEDSPIGLTLEQMMEDAKGRMHLLNRLISVEQLRDMEIANPEEVLGQLKRFSHVTENNHVVFHFESLGGEFKSWWFSKQRQAGNRRNFSEIKLKNLEVFLQQSAKGLVEANPGEWVIYKKSAKLVVNPLAGDGISSEEKERFAGQDSRFGSSGAGDSVGKDTGNDARRRVEDFFPNLASDWDSALRDQKGFLGMNDLLKHRLMSFIAGVHGLMGDRYHVKPELVHIIDDIVAQQEYYSKVAAESAILEIKSIRGTRLDPNYKGADTVWVAVPGSLTEKYLKPNLGLNEDAVMRMVPDGVKITKDEARRFLQIAENLDSKSSFTSFRLQKGWLNNALNQMANDRETAIRGVPEDIDNHRLEWLRGLDESRKKAIDLILEEMRRKENLKGIDADTVKDYLGNAYAERFRAVSQGEEWSRLRILFDALIKDRLIPKSLLGLDFDQFIEAIHNPLPLQAEDVELIWTMPKHVYELSQEVFRAGMAVEDLQDELHQSVSLLVFMHFLAEAWAYQPYQGKPQNQTPAMATVSPASTSQDIKRAANGGIDFNSRGMRLDEQGDKLNVQFDPAQINDIRQHGVRGFQPNIIRVITNVNLMSFVGLKEDEQAAGALAKT